MSPEEAIVSIVIVAMVIGIPFLGLTLRFVLKPVVDTWLRVREAQSNGAPVAELEALRARVAHLEHMLDLHGMLERPGAGRTSSPELPERLPTAVRLDRERV
ncbi:hypothetical protein D7V97_30305 [Corallococcus sp. CA053C]|uniref:hypothetical protein n=1 Tax=Corallococcus sp. CA053C TaxID=2316732 RepID=UPI000EA33E45|nr:hypothetical protein [Corallococcus sp. CA053C]RKH00432.1 hypothetical protein D7V97_30305 [Corallococcus sp. CA053C]